MVDIPKTMLFIVTLVGLLGCSAPKLESFEQHSCQCDGDKCPSNRCSFRIEMTQTCVGRVRKAEVLINDHLEAFFVTPSASKTSCYSVVVGESAWLTVRSNDWEWGPSEETCTPDAAGRSVHITLDCCECVTGLDCQQIGKGNVCGEDCTCQ